jgi:O-antigen/teichoic acid export membrane protein
MGIVLKQSFWNLATTVLGIALGAFNVLFLYVQYLDKEYFGLSQYILSAAFIVFPIMGFGIQNTIVRFFSGHKDRKSRDAFLIRMLLLPLLIIIPLGAFLLTFYHPIATYLSQQNALVYQYVWLIYLVAIAVAYFEVFFAWAKVHMKTIAGNFLKEVFYRLGVTVSLALVALDVIGDETFIYSLVSIYSARALIMLIIALKTYRPQFNLKFKVPIREAVNYSILMVIAGTVGTAMIDLDKTMINQYLPLENINYYTMAAYVAALVAVPARAMAQITHPLTAQYYNSQDFNSMGDLYKRSSLTLTLIGGLIFLLITCNIQQFYKMQPEEYAVAVPIVFLIGLVKLSENVLGSNNAILYNTNLYKITMWLGLALAVVAIFLNALLIPRYGIIGAAVATGISYLAYVAAKLAVVNLKLQLHPWSKRTGIGLLLIGSTLVIFYFWNFNFQPFINIVLKSLLLTFFYVVLVLALKISTDLNQLWRNALLKIGIK